MCNCRDFHFKILILGIITLTANSSLLHVKGEIMPLKPVLYFILIRCESIYYLNCDIYFHKLLVYVHFTTFKVTDTLTVIYGVTGKRLLSYTSTCF